jgi:hypothetical protein
VGKGREGGREGGRCSRFCWWPALLGAHARLSAGVAQRTPNQPPMGVLRVLPIACVRVSGSVGRNAGARLLCASDGVCVIVYV